MPKYDLKCEACDLEFNIRASISEKTEKRISCPECGGAELMTVFKTAPAFLKGEAKCPSSATCGSGGCRYAS